MKFILYTLVFLLGFQSFAQKRKRNPLPLHLDSLREDGARIRNWRYHSGDNTRWKDPAFDDTKWPIVTPSDNFVDIKDFDQDSIGWLRAKIHKDTLPQMVAIAISQVAASELYINGKKIKTFGEIDANPYKTIGYNPIKQPFFVTLDKDSIQLIAVRIAKPAGVPHYGSVFFPTHLLSFKLYKPDDAFQSYISTRNDQYFWALVKASIFLILFIIHLSFYNSQKSQFANLFFAIFTLSNALNEAIFLFITYYNTNVASYNYFNTLNLVLTSISNIFFMQAIYSQFELKRNWGYWILSGGFLLLPFCYFANNILGTSTFIFLSIILYVQLTIVIFNAIAQKKRGAHILAVGIFSVIVTCVLFLIAFVVFTVTFQQDTVQALVEYFAEYIMNIKDVAMSVCLSIYLALEFGHINKALNDKILEIQRLSSEKQQILETQNERLEHIVNERTAELQDSIETLQRTQAQLIQKEKLASLGELTAGIAHEIQNPLNFVNNFAELSGELIEELKSPLTPDGGIRDGEKIDMDLIDDLTQNLEKINHHGKRASNIVKGMLEHSRMGTGEPQLTNINTLCDECLRLAYHGIRAKDKNFTAHFNIQLAENLPAVQAIPQDLTRVLLNLLNNAFYAIQQRVVTETNTDYEPAIHLMTHMADEYIVIKVGDNGTGIPEHVKSKIFQPFFTTKPTGEGTGLGLSLSYDIITQGHGGIIELESQEGVGSQFIIKLPL
ncbi:MAG: ATP-binding protein [Spirosomataceae bacterium]